MAIETACQSATSSPSIFWILSPDTRPAAAPGESSRTVPTSVDTSRVLGRSMPTMKTTATSRIESTTFIAGPAR